MHFQQAFSAAVIVLIPIRVFYIPFCLPLRGEEQNILRYLVGALHRFA